MFTLAGPPGRRATEGEPPCRMRRSREGPGRTGTPAAGTALVLDSLQRRMHAPLLAVLRRGRHHGPRPGQPLRARGRPAHRLQPVPHRQHDRRVVPAHDRHAADLGRRRGRPGSTRPSPTTASTGRSRRWSTSASATTTQFQAYMRHGVRPGRGVAGRPRPRRADPAGHPPAVPGADRQHLQRPGGRPRGDHPPRRHRVLDLPARAPPHGGDRAGPRAWWASAA